MARNREPVKPVDESESESSEEKGSSSEEESDADLNPTPPQNKPQPPPQPQMPVKPSPPLPAPSSSDEEEDSGSETESESDAPDSNAKPLAARPVEETPTPIRKARAKPAADPVTPAKSASAKRPADDASATSKDAKKAKKSPGADPEGSERKSNLFQRLWSEEDGIVILQGVIDYQNKYKQDPIANLDHFHDYIKERLQADGTRAQLQDKIRRLRKKYGNLKSKEKDGKERTFSKTHEQMAYDLSKVIWGNEEKAIVKAVGSPRANGSVVRRAAARIEDVKGGEREEKRSSLKPGGATTEEWVCTYGENAFGSGDGEEEWNKLKAEEVRLYLRQLEVKVLQAKLVLSALESRYQ